MRHLRFSGILALATVAVASAGLVLAGGTGCAQNAEQCAEHYRTSYQTKGWLGIEVEKAEDGTVTIIKVHPDSPAEKAAIQAGDQLASVNGIPYTRANHDKLKEMKEQEMKIGSTVTYELKRGSETIRVEATLAEIPQAVLAAMIDRHTRKQHAAAGY